MGIEWYRDLVICIMGIITIVTLIFIASLFFFLYRKIKLLTNKINILSDKANYIVDNVQATTQNVQGIVANFKETMSSPINQICAIVNGIRQGTKLVNRLFTKQGAISDE